MSPKPTIICVPGAWHSPSHYDALVQRLSSAGYKTSPVTLATVGASPPLEDFHPDVDAIRAAIKKVVDAGDDALIIAHSYGTLPTAEAIEGYQKENSKPGVSHFIFCAAFVPVKGLSLIELLGEQSAPWIKVSDDGKTCFPQDPHNVFYADCSDEVSKIAAEALKPFSFPAMSHKSNNQGWREVPCTYMFCVDDMALPYQAQQAMVDGSGIDFTTVTFKTSHSPFLSKPDETALEIRRVAGEAV